MKSNQCYTLKKHREMATYTLNIDKRTKKGHAIYVFLNDIDCVVDNMLVIDERDSFNKNLVDFLRKEQAIKFISIDSKIEKVVSERFLKNRKRTGKLSDKELIMLNSQINMSKYLSKKEL